MDESKPLEEIRTWEHPPLYGIDQFKERVILTFLENQKGLFHNSDSFPDAGEAIHDFWSMSGNFIYCHHVEPRVKLLLAERWIIPYSTEVHWCFQNKHTNLDVKQEKRIDDYWNIDGSRDMSDPLTGFTQFTLLEEKAPDGHMWSGRRLTRKQQTSRPGHLWPELWKSMGKNAKLKEKQKWSEEKIHLDNARKLRGIYFIDPEDKEFKETIKNARKKLETSVATAMPCKILEKNCGEWWIQQNKNKTCVYSRSWWIYENAYGKFSTKLSWRPYCRKKRHFITALKICSQIYSYASSYENSCSKSSGGQGMGNIGEKFGVEPHKSQK